MPMTLTELDVYFKERGVNVIVNRFQYHVDERVVGERINVTIDASGFRLDESVNLTPAEDLKNFDNILKEAVDHGKKT